jgi:platelet-activating factor acetylhydrolase IB subunit alpha
VKTFTGHSEWVREVVPSEDGRWLVSASSDQVSRPLCPMEKGLMVDITRMGLCHEHVVECAAFAPVASYPMIRELAGIAVSSAGRVA